MRRIWRSSVPDGNFVCVLVKDGVKLAVTGDLSPRLVMKRCHGEGRARTCVVLYFAACAVIVLVSSRASLRVQRLSGMSDL